MGKKYLILVVDDIKENRLLLRKLIESINHTVQEASNGKEALESARTLKPDFIISDILMPVMDGFQLCMQIKKDEFLKSIPFIFYTATYTSKKDEEFVLSLGAIRFIVKPQEPDKFLEIIRDVLNAHEKGTLPEPKNIICNEKEVFKLFNERLVNKLEQKMLDLEKENTENIQLLETLKKSEDLLNATQKITKAGGWRWDINERTMFWTEETYRIHEADFYEIKPGSTEHMERGVECYAEKDLQVIMDAFQSCAEKGISYDMEFPFTTFKGNMKWIRTSGKPVKENGNIIGVVGNIMDITEIKKAEEELKKYKDSLEDLVIERTVQLEN
ncbi:MAG: response regulator [Spirochaetia bacterium]|jgi:CheY-like chemotaxis protein|nr:response regulator [Spirochaetia bacterium]